MKPHRYLLLEVRTGSRTRKPSPAQRSAAAQEPKREPAAGSRPPTEPFRAVRFTESQGRLGLARLRGEPKWPNRPNPSSLAGSAPSPARRPLIFPLLLLVGSPRPVSSPISSGGSALPPAHPGPAGAAAPSQSTDRLAPRSISSGTTRHSSRPLLRFGLASHTARNK